MRAARGLVLLGMLVLGACAPRPQPRDCVQPEVFCVGMVTSFGQVDTGINRQAWLGLQDARSARLADRVDLIETVSSLDRAANIEALAANGYDVIVTVGSSIGKETLQAASRHPKLNFIGIQQPQQKKLHNLTGLVFREDFGGFLAGALAARTSRTGQVGAVCEAEFVDSVRRYCEGFKAGAQYAKPGIGVTISYHDGSSETLFNDPEWGRSEAIQQVEQGADVVFATGGQTEDAALEAAAAGGAYVIGSETDRYMDLPDIRPSLLSSATNDVRSNLVDILTLTRRGRFPGGEYTGTESLAPWHDFDRQVPASLEQELDAIYVRLSLGVIRLDIPYTQP